MLYFIILEAMIHIMQEIGKFNKDINVIPNNLEKYTAFIIGNLIFTDSFQFINQSLSNLANNLPKDGFYDIENEFGSINLELITQKVYIPMIIWMILINSKTNGCHQ